MSRVAPRRSFLSPSPRRARSLGAVALACASIVLASCGGGDRKSYFTPSNIVSFGDENSAIVTDSTSSLLDNTLPIPGASASLKGLSYTAKAVRVDSNYVCSTDPSATQVQTCGADNGQGASFVASGGATYHVLINNLNLVTKYEAGTVSATPSQRTTTVNYNCDVPSTWVQIIARAYGKGFTTNCPQDTRGGAISHATLGAKTADVIGQINANRGSLNGNTVVTIMVGQNDIIELYEAVRASSQSEGAATAELQTRATSMATAIKDVIGTGAKVILALTPDLSETPYGLGGDKALLDRLVRAYNDRLYITGLGNVSGRSLAGVNPESYTQPNTRSSSYEYTTPLCDATAVRRPDGTTPANDDEKLLYCTSQYYTSGTAASTAIWADAKRAAPLLHNLIGVTVYNRAREQF